MPITAKELFAAGRVREAEKVLTAYLREHPSDKAQRTFLFELLCFAGEYARAEKQLAVLAGGSVESETGAIVYYAALHAEKTRQELFEKQAFPAGPTASPRGKLNGKAFKDAVATRIRISAPGSRFSRPARMSGFPLSISPRSRWDRRKGCRDTLWAPAMVQAAASFKEMDLGEVLMPAIYPFSWKHPDEAVWLGRVTGLDSG